VSGDNTVIKKRLLYHYRQTDLALVESMLVISDTMLNEEKLEDIQTRLFYAS